MPANNPMQVQDRPTELSTRISNLLQSLILAALIGVVTLLYDIKEELSAVNRIQAVQENEIKHLKIILDSHVNNDNVHFRGPR